MIEPFASPTTRVAGVVARPAVAHHAHMALRIDPMTADDAAAVIRIYAEGIATRNASLERVAPDWAHFDRSHRDDCRFVARDDAAGDVLGWTALGNYSPRAVYRGVAWESVYVGAAARGLGVGRALLEALIPASEAAGIWTLLASVLADNTATSPSTSVSGSGRSASSAGWARMPRAAGAMSCSWNAAVGPSASRTPRRYPSQATERRWRHPRAA
jgi:phosphinothricin acetyltransferase